MTATFKHRKHELVRDGYDPAATTDAIYYNNQRSQAYVRVDVDFISGLSVGRSVCRVEQRAMPCSRHRLSTLCP